MGDTTNLLVGYGNSDDAAVYKIDEKKVMVQSVDLFPPMVDDPYLFGQIAASNSLSDIYAMGASPNLCMNILAFPSDMNLEYVRSILEGGYEKVIEAGAVIAGGHTLNDNEPKYGLSVTGITDIDKVLRNDKAKEGDLLILTKPIGNGIINNAFKGGYIPKIATDKAIEYMVALNKYAYEIMSKY
jgi:selenide,water dikinase